MEKLLKRKSKAKADNNNTLLAAACIDLAEYYKNDNNFHAAIEEYNTVASIYQSQNKMLDYGCANRMIGEAYTQLQQYDKALEYEEIYLKVSRKEANKMEEQRALATIGHTYLTMSLDDGNIELLNKASKYFLNSLDVCENLTGISKNEQMDMKARLYANLGLVKEAQGKFEKGIELVQTSINICKRYDIFEQLERCYITLCSLYLKSGQYSSAISNLNLALEVAKRLPEKLSLTCSSLLNKGEILMKMADIQGAKRVFHKAYKLKTPVISDRISIEKNLQVVSAMSYAEESLLTVPEFDYQTKKSLYERLGDGACHFKNYSSAIEYYKMMLNCALNINESGKSLSPCYVSLAQTFLDNKEYDEAIEYYRLDLQSSENNLKEHVNTQFNILHAMELAKKDSMDILELFQHLENKCNLSENNKQLARVLDRKHLYYKRRFMLSEAQHVLNSLEQLNIVLSESDSSETEDDADTLGCNIDLDKITDVSSSDDERDLSIVTTRKRVRNKAFSIKRNVKGETQLHVACIAGNITLVEKLLGQGHIVNVRDHAGWLPIHEACICGHLEIVEMLVDKGAAINDRGGAKCEGITPLHDAATNGHLDVIEYLIDHGASPLAKNDNGETPVQMLKRWRIGVSLDNEEEEAYQRIVDNMTTAIQKAGHHETNATFDITNDALVLMEDDSCSKEISHSSHLRPIRRNASRYDLECTQTSNDLRRAKNPGDDETFSVKDVSDYRDAIDLLKNPGAIENKKRKSINTSLNAHVPGNNDYLDDWLEDDLGVNNKKRKTTTNVQPLLMGTLTFTHIDDENNIINDVENQEPNKSENSRRIFSQRKRKSQMTLLKSGFTRNRTTPSPTNTMHDVDCVITNSFKNKTRSSENLSQSRSETNVNVTQTLIKNQMLFVDVRIEEKLFRIPFPAKDLEVLTINWLSDETTKRFYKKEAMKPIIEMESKNGAILSDDDVLSVLFPVGTTQCEELRANVIKWNIPPLRERYLDSCQYMNSEPLEEIANTLEATTISLNISNRNYRENIVPVCQAINRQTNLYELNLSGNLAGQKMIECLCESLPSLVNLTKLVLSANHLTSNNLSILSSTIKQHSFSNLKHLDLSFNPLGNESITYLSQITGELSLEYLLLSGTDLSTGLFDPSYNRSTNINLRNLITFDISFNELETSDINVFLQFLNFEKLQNLNVSENCIDASGFGKRFYDAVKDCKQILSLKSLNISRCSLNDEDIFDLESALINAKQLEQLDLNYNNFTGAGLKRILENLSPIGLSIIGCDELKRECPEYNPKNAWKFDFNKNCKSLRSSLDNVKDFKQCGIILNMFKEIYNDNLDIQGLEEGVLKICVVHE